jgi:hypothetical protein
MATHQADSCFPQNALATGHDLTQYFSRQGTGRKKDQIHGSNGAGTHGVDIGDCIGGGYPAKGEWIINQRSNNVSRFHQGALRRNPVDTGIISSFRSYKQVCVAVFPKPVQGFRQARWAQFRGSTGGFYQLR